MTKTHQFALGLVRYYQIHYRIFSLLCNFDDVGCPNYMSLALGVSIKCMCMFHILYVHLDAHLDLLSFETSSGKRFILCE